MFFQIALADILLYIRAGGYNWYIAIGIFFASSVMCQVWSNVWLGAWSDDHDTNNIDNRRTVIMRLRIYCLLTSATGNSSIQIA